MKPLRRREAGDRAGGHRADDRHRSLRSALDWSYTLLDPSDQAVLRRLSVFAGGWTLDSATRVAGEKADEFEIMDLLSRLVDKSLVLVERDRGAEPRYGLLETVRQYAEDRLKDSGEEEAVRQRHLEFFLAFAEKAGAGPISC